MPVSIPTPAVLSVKWGCRRCGYRGGVARTTVPVVERFGNQEEVMQTLLNDLRRKLALRHMQQGCFAARDDFIIEAHVPNRSTLIAKV